MIGFARRKILKPPNPAPPGVKRKSMAKYVTVEISGIVTQIAKELEPGYTEGVIEIFFPDEGELPKNQEKQWIAENNKRMKAICKFLNENNL